jgi:hypothetical protein
MRTALAPMLAPMLALAAPAAAQPAWADGTWTIEKAEIASWADPKIWADETEAKKLIGQTVAFGARSVEAPPPLYCTRPVYTVRDMPPEGLFEGGLSVPDYAGRPQDAKALAVRLGLTAATAPTLETCTEIQFHRISDDTMVFALDNRIYTMKRK